jgi:DNA-binding protein H-NS
MPQTYHQLKKHIAELQAQAEGVKRSEVAGVIAKAKEAIRVYGLTRQDLFDAKTRRTAQASKGVAKKAARAKYQDDAGHSWSGFGPRPKWLKEGIAGGKKLEDFLG